MDVKDMASIEEWTGYLASRGRKELTVETYRQELGRCLRKLEEDGRPTDPNQIGVEDVFFLKAKLGVSEESTKKYLKVLGMYTEHYTGKDVFKEADILWNPPQPKRLFIQDQDLDRLFAVADARERLILLLGSSMGLRRAEIVTVKWSDIDSGRLTVHGKGHGDGKVVSMRIPEKVAEAMDEWRLQRDRLGLRDESGGCIIPAIQKGRLTAMAPTSLSHIMRELGERADVRVTAHSLRRNFATKLYSRHVDVVDIKELLRHESIETTVRCYIQADKTRLDSILENF